MILSKSTQGVTLNDVSFQERVTDRFNSAVACVSGAAASMAVAGISAFADGEGETTAAMGNVESGIKSGLGDLWGLLKGIAVPIAAIAAVFCAFSIITGGEKGMEKAKKIALYLIIGLAVVYLGPLLVQTVASWFSDAGTTNVFG